MDNLHYPTLPYSIVYEDPSLLIVDKSQGLATTPGTLPSLCTILFLQYPELRAVHGYRAEEGGLLNRLDNDTGGLVLFARTDTAFSFYAKRMIEEKIEKKYLAIINGTIIPESGIIDIPIGHSKKNKKRMLAKKGNQSIRGRWQQAFTYYRTLEIKRNYSLLEISITKGVRHQIRVHLRAKATPIAGDKLYNPDNSETLYPYHLLYAYAVHMKNIEGKTIQVQVVVPFLDMWNNW